MASIVFEKELQIGLPFLTQRFSASGGIFNLVSHIQTRHWQYLLPHISSSRNTREHTLVKPFSPKFYPRKLIQLSISHIQINRRLDKVWYSGRIQRALTSSYIRVDRYCMKRGDLGTWGTGGLKNRDFNR